MSSRTQAATSHRRRVTARRVSRTRCDRSQGVIASLLSFCGVVLVVPVFYVIASPAAIEAAGPAVVNVLLLVGGAGLLALALAAIACCMGDA